MCCRSEHRPCHSYTPLLSWQNCLPSPRHGPSSPLPAPHCLLAWPSSPSFPVKVQVIRKVVGHRMLCGVGRSSNTGNSFFFGPFRSLYWICYNIASVVYILIFQPWDMWDLSSQTRDKSNSLHWKTRFQPLDPQGSPDRVLFIYVCFCFLPGRNHFTLSQDRVVIWGSQLTELISCNCCQLYHISCHHKQILPFGQMGGYTPSPPFPWGYICGQNHNQTSKSCSSVPTCMTSLWFSQAELKLVFP